VNVGHFTLIYSRSPFYIISRLKLLLSKFWRHETFIDDKVFTVTSKDSQSLDIRVGCWQPSGATSAITGGVADAGASASDLRHCCGCVRLPPRLDTSTLRSSFYAVTHIPVNQPWRVARPNFYHVLGAMYQVPVWDADELRQRLAEMRAECQLRVVGASRTTHASTQFLAWSSSCHEVPFNSGLFQNHTLFCGKHCNLDQISDFWHACHKVLRWRCSVAATILSNLFGILLTKNRPDRFIFDYLKN